MKYIPTEKLIAEIERRRLSNRYIDTEGYENELLEIITSLQQEQPEVDLEKELNNERTKLLDAFGPMNGEQCLAIRNFARHFYELGLNSKKEEGK